MAECVKELTNRKTRAQSHLTEVHQMTQCTLHAAQ